MGKIPDGEYQQEVTDAWYQKMMEAVDSWLKP